MHPTLTAAEEKSNKRPLQKLWSVKRVVFNLLHINIRKNIATKFGFPFMNSACLYSVKEFQTQIIVVRGRTVG